MKIIKPNDIQVEGKISCKTYNSDDAISKLTGIDKKDIQHITCEKIGDLMECEMHPLVEAAHHAYASHLPLVLTPDAIWYCISSAIAIHIKQNWEELRNKFVDHEGKKKIEIRRDDFVFGSQENPWNEVVDEFCNQMRELTKADIVDKLQADYSTTSKVAKVTSQIVIMDAMQYYFHYYVMTKCGVPEIRVMGEKEDWIKIKTRANELIDMFPELKDWSIGLNEILEHFIMVFDDKIVNDFWNRIYKIYNGSGGRYVSGWIIGLFPYLKGEKKNLYCWEGQTWKDADQFSGIKTTDCNYCINTVPFTWNYLNTEIKMLFCGGLIGCNINKSDFSLTPIFGYAITNDKIN